MLRPVALLLRLRTSCFIILFAFSVVLVRECAQDEADRREHTDPHQYTHRVVVEGKANSMRPSPHLDCVAHVVLQPIVYSPTYFGLPRSHLPTPSPAEIWQSAWSEVEVDQLARVCVLGS